MALLAETIDTDRALSRLLAHYCTELTSRDHKSLDAAGQLLAPGSQVFIASLPGDTIDNLVAAAVQLRQSGLLPVPHIVARNTDSFASLDKTLSLLVERAGVDRCLVLGGDRDTPAGEFDSALQLIQTGLLQKHGIRKIALGCYPEGHPRISDAVLESALLAKLDAAKAADMEVWLVSQFCFDAAPILAMVRRLRSLGVSAPLQVGVAGPANRTTLIKYAMICGVGASLRVMKERQDMAKHLIAGETPEGLLQVVAAAQAADPALGISGVHFFTFGSLQKSAEWAREHSR
jgi:methylenetetrahydrofolate reductase (NADPH)